MVITIVVILYLPDASRVLSVGNKLDKHVFIYTVQIYADFLLFSNVFFV